MAWLGSRAASNGIARGFGSGKVGSSGFPEHPEPCPRPRRAPFLRVLGPALTGPSTPPPRGPRSRDYLDPGCPRLPDAFAGRAGLGMARVGARALRAATPLSGGGRSRSRGGAGGTRASRSRPGGCGRGADAAPRRRRPDVPARRPQVRGARAREPPSRDADHDPAGPSSRGSCGPDPDDLGLRPVGPPMGAPHRAGVRAGDPDMAARPHLGGARGGRGEEADPGSPAALPGAGGACGHRDLPAEREMAARFGRAS